MTDHDAALRFDTALDQLARGEPTPPDPLVDTARAMRRLDAMQQAVASEAFRARLRGTLVGVGAADHLNGHYTVVAGTLSAPLPERPEPSRSSHRWPAIAAALLLLLIGGGAIVLEGIGIHDDREPRAIPAVSFASPTTERGSGTGTPAPARPTGVLWELPAPETGMGIQTVTEAFADGTLYRLLVSNGVDGSTFWVQAIDTASGTMIWEHRFQNGGFALAAFGSTVYTITTHRAPAAYSVVALEASTGDERWSAELSGNTKSLSAPVLIATENHLYALTGDGRFEVFDAETGAIDFGLPLVDEQSMASSPLSILPIVDPSRMAFDGDILAVVVGDGSVAGVDIARGLILWRIQPDGIGAHAVYAIDGRFVVLASKGMAASAPPVSPGRPTMVASPIPENCERFIERATTADATPILGQTGAMELLGVDTRAGSVEWRAWANAAVQPILWAPPSDTTLVLMVASTDAWPNDGSQAIVCEVNSATGEVGYEAGQSSIVAQSFVVHWTGDNSYSEIRLFDNGWGIALSRDAEVASEGIIELDGSADAVTRIVSLGGQVFISFDDGRLIALDSLSS